MSRLSSVLLALAMFSQASCAETTTSQKPNPQQVPPPQPYGYPQPQPYPPQAQPYPSQPQPQQPQPYPQQPAPTRPPAQPTPPAQRALLPPLSPPAWQNEVRSVLTELIASLSPSNAALVRGIPLVFDPDPNEVNAFAGCDDRGAPYLAGTVGLLYAVDAIAQTKATDELFGTTTYEAYSAAVIPQLVKSDKASPALPSGIIPAQYWNDARRLSRAHEIFDDIVAFTFGHELAHHYRGHTGCAHGQPMTAGPLATDLGRIAANVIPGINQFNEAEADREGCINVLDTGRARAPNFRWSEAGGLMLLDYFGRLDRAAGISPLNPIGFLRSHPNPAFRIPGVQFTAATWRMQHPG